MMTLGKVIFKVAKALLVSGAAAVGAKAVYSAVQAAKKTKREIEEREEEKTVIDYTDNPDGVTVHAREFISTKDKFQIFGDNFIDVITDPLPGKAGKIEETFWMAWQDVGLVTSGLVWGYVLCAADYDLDTDAAAKKYGGPSGDDAFAEAAYATDVNAEVIVPGTIYAFGKDYSGKSCCGKFDFNQLKTRDEIVAESAIKSFCKCEQK